MSVKLLMNNKRVEDATFNVYIMDTTKTANDLVVTLANDRGGDTTEWDGITDWGDGTRNASLTHTYISDGRYKIKTKYKLDNSNNCANNTRKKLIDCKSINKNMTNLKSMFNNCYNLTIINIPKWDTTNVTNMSYMFMNCANLTTLDVSNWNTSKVVYMNNMFSGCSKLTTVDTSKWNTLKVTSMDSMFRGCSQLSALNVSKWNTSRVKNMSFMFGACTKLTTLDVSNWDVNNVTDMSRMISSCSSLTTLDVANWNTSNVTNMEAVFGDCSKLATLDVSKWDTGKATNIAWLFSACYQLEPLDVSNWNTTNVTSMTGVFNGCSKLIGLDLSKWNTGKVVSMSNLFYGCTSLRKLNISNWDVSKVANMSKMFTGCNLLTELKLLTMSSEDILKLTDNTKTGFPYHTPYTQDTYKLYVSESIVNSVDVNEIQTNRGWTVKGADNSTRFNIYTIDTTKTTGDLAVTLADDRGGDATEWDGITDWGDGSQDNTLTHTYTSDGKYEIKTKYKLDISSNYINNTRKKIVGCKMINKNMTDMNNMFARCDNLTTVDASKWDTSNVTVMRLLFNNCSSLTTLDLSNLNTTNVTDMSWMFSNCKSLISLNVSTWDTSNVTTMLRMFSGCSSLTTLDVANWNVSKVESMSSTFFNCSALTTLDVTNWNVSNATSLGSMFTKCMSLTTLDLSKWNVSKVTSIGSMFGNCPNLTTLNLSNWDISKVTAMNTVFINCPALTDLKLLNVSAEHISKLLDDTVTRFPYHVPFVQDDYKLYVSVSVDTNDIQANKGWTVIGRNLVPNSAFINGSSKWQLAEGVSIDNTVTFNGHPTVKADIKGLTSPRWLGCMNYNLSGSNGNNFSSGDTISISCWYYVKDKSTFDDLIGLELKGRKSAGTDEVVIMGIKTYDSMHPLEEGKWVKLAYTKTLDADYINCCVRAFVSKNGTAWFTDFKVEYGNEATSWTPAPEDSSGTVRTVTCNKIGYGFNVNTGATEPATSNYAVCEDYIPVKKGTKYRMATNCTRTGTWIAIMAYNSDYSFKSKVINAQATSSEFTAPSDYIRVGSSMNNDTTVPIVTLTEISSQI